MTYLIPMLLTFLVGFFTGATSIGLLAKFRMGAQADLSATFKALAADTLRANNETFLQLAETRLKQNEMAAAATLDKKASTVDEMVKPVKETLQKMDEQLRALESNRTGAYEKLMEAVRMSHETQQQLRGETSQLLQALRTPTTRGRWGEIQLRRILEMSGMSEHTSDFSAQKTFTGDDGVLRPDMIVKLPGAGCIIIDSKVPLGSYLDASQCPDENERVNAIKNHARHVRDHIKQLSAKAYWDQVEGTPEFVVLFMPGDHFLGAALDADPELMDFSARQKIILATPMTLMALLRAVAYGWRQESLRENALRIGVLGGELYNSIITMTDRFNTLGGKLAAGIDSYNKLIGNIERNVLVKARRLRDYGAEQDGKALAEISEPVEIQNRMLASGESPSAEEDAA